MALKDKLKMPSPDAELNGAELDDMDLEAEMPTEEAPTDYPMTVDEMQMALEELGYQVMPPANEGSPEEEMSEGEVY